MVKAKNTNWEGRKFGDIKEELAEEITNCSSCRYWKGKSESYLWGDRPCSQHKRMLIKLEDEIEKVVGKDVIAMIENYKITIIQRPTPDQFLEMIIKTPYIRKNKSKQNGSKK